MKVTLGSKPPYAWQSILWGCELFEKGYRWRVGNGYNINIGSDPWISREGSFKPVFTPTHIHHNFVAWLMIGRSSRNEEKVGNNFVALEADQILQIPLPRTDIEDVVI